MRTVRDKRGVTWICLELPEVPADQTDLAAAASAPVVAIECNSGAARVIAMVSPGWDDALSDEALTQVIESARP